MNAYSRKISLVLVSVMFMLGLLLTAFQPASDVRQFEGITINVFMEVVPDTNYVKEYVDEFEEMTGMTVNIEELTYSVMHEKLIPQASAGEGQGAYDLVVVDKQWVGEFVCADWLLPLDDFIERDGFDTSVYTPAMFDMVGQVNGVTYMLPFYNYSTGLLYRSDVFEDEELKAEYEAEFGVPLEVPKTVEDYVQVAKFLTRDTDGDGEVDFYGAVGQLERYSSYFEWSMVLFGLDAWYYDEDWNATVNDETGLMAMEYLLDLYQNAMPEAATAYKFSEKMEFAAQGKSAMMLIYSWMPNLLNDPEASEYAGLFEFTVAPGGHGAQGGWGWAIPKSAPNPEAAWAFLSYIESFEVAKGRAMLGGQPVRDDVFNDPDVLEANPMNAIMKDVVGGAKPIPIICNSAQVPEAIALGVSEALADIKEPQEALDMIAEELNEIVVDDPLTGK